MTLRNVSLFFLPLSLFLSFLFSQNRFAFSTADPGPTNKQSVLLPFHPPPRALLNNHSVFSSVRTFGATLLRGGWVPVPGHVQGGWLVAHPHRGRLRAPSTWQGKFGREVYVQAALPVVPPSPATGLSAHQSIAASMPWFPVRARAFSLRAKLTVNSAHEPWRRSGWGVEPEARLG